MQVKNVTMFTCAKYNWHLIIFKNSFIIFWHTVYINEKEDTLKERLKENWSNLAYYLIFFFFLLKVLSKLFLKTYMI